jgi:hypothetical protein
LYLYKNISLGNYFHCILGKKTRNAPWPGTIHFIFVIKLLQFGNIFLLEWIDWKENQALWHCHKSNAYVSTGDFVHT